MKTSYPLSLFIFLSFSTFAQSLPSGQNAQQNLDNLASPDYSSVVQTFNTAYEGVKGDPYFPENWTVGKVFLHDGKVKESTDLKIDVVEGHLWEQQSDGEIKAFVRDKVDSFDLMDASSGKISHFEHFREGMPLENEEPIDRGFYQVLHKGKCVLFVQKGHYIKKADYQGAYSAGRKYDEIIHVDRVFLKKEDGTYYRIKASKKALISPFPEKEDMIKKYIKKEKINPKNKDDLVKLVAYYESLL